jgi:hypothetical protein
MFTTDTLNSAPTSSTKTLVNSVSLPPGIPINRPMDAQIGHDTAYVGAQFAGTGDAVPARFADGDFEVRNGSTLPSLLSG